eukprot:329928-Prymnesium_polylepis.2
MHADTEQHEATAHSLQLRERCLQSAQAAIEAVVRLEIAVARRVGNDFCCCRVANNEDRTVAQQGERCREVGAIVGEASMCHQGLPDVQVQARLPRARRSIADSAAGRQAACRAVATNRLRKCLLCSVYGRCKLAARSQVGARRALVVIVNLRRLPARIVQPAALVVREARIRCRPHAPGHAGGCGTREATSGPTRLPAGCSAAGPASPPSLRIRGRRVGVGGHRDLVVTPVHSATPPFNFK